MLLKNEVRQPGRIAQAERAGTGSIICGLALCMVAFLPTPSRSQMIDLYRYVMPDNSNPGSYKRKKLDSLYQETHGGVQPWPLEYDRILTRRIRNPHTNGDGFVTAAGWSWPFIPGDAKCAGHDGDGSHIYTLWSIDNDWIGVNGDGISGVKPNGHEGGERKWVLRNGDHRGGIFSPRYVDKNRDIVIPMHHDPAWAADYHFSFVSPPIAGGARLYSYDCSGKPMSTPTDWAGEIRVRHVYKLWGFNILEIWSGNDGLWEIYAFSPGRGLVGYRQWWYQAKQGRQVFWAEPLDDSHHVKGAAFEASF